MILFSDEAVKGFKMNGVMEDHAVSQFAVAHHGLVA